MKRFSFPFRIAVFTGSLVLCFFMALIYLEDILIFQKMQSETGWEPHPEVYFGRVLLALSLSLGVSIFVYISAFRFVHKLNEFSRLILDWARRYFPDYDLTLDSGYQEINAIKEVFRSSVYANKSKETGNISNIVFENNKLFVEQIIPIIHNLEKIKSEQLDIAFFPHKSFIQSNDYLDYIKTRNGFLFVLCGFSINDPLTASYKARIQSIFSLAKEIYFIEEEELLSHIQTAIRQHSIPKLNITLFFVSQETFIIKFLHFQNTPIMFWEGSKLEEIPVIGETEYPFIEFNSDLRPQFLKTGEYFIVITDRILDKRYFEINSYLENWKKNISANKIHFSSSTQVLEHLRQYLDSILKEKGATEKIDDFFSCIVVGKK